MDKKHCDLLRLFFTATALEGLAAAVLVALSPTGSSISYILNTALAVAILLLSLCFVWLSYRTAHSPEICERFYTRVDRLRSNKKAALFVWLGLAITIIIIIGLLAIPTGITGITLVVKRITFPLIWIGLIAAQFGFLLQGSYPLGDSVKFFFQDVLPVTTGSDETPSSPEKKSRLIFNIGLIITMLYIINLFIISLPNPRFSADSYKYWYLSKTIGVDFYRINYVTQYIFEQPYSVDAPPLYPALIWLVNRIYDLKIYGGYLINFLIALGMFILLQRIGRILFHNPVFSSVISIVLFSFVHFQRELTGARVIPLATLLQLSIVYIVLKHDQLKTRHIVLIGLLAGLNIMTRFDFLLASLVLGLVLATIDRQDRLKRSFIYYGLLALCYSPWVIYSYTHFGVPIASQDSRTVYSVVLTHSNHYFPPGREPLSIMEAPLQWLPTMLLRVRLVAVDFVETLTISPFVALLLAAVLVMVVAGLLKSLYCCSFEKKPVFLDDITIKLSQLGMVFAALWFTTALSGYALERYYTPAFLYLSIWLITMINRAFNEVLSPGRLGSMLASALLLLPPGIAWYTTPKAYDLGYTLPELAVEMRSQMSLEDEFDILQGLPTEPVVFVADGYNYAKFGVLSGYRTYCMPFNLDEGNIDDYFQQYDDITHLLIPTTPTYRFLAQHLLLERIDESLPLYKLTGLR